MMKWSRRKVLSDFSVAIVSQYLVQFILFFRNFIFAKLLGPYDFGVYSSIFLFFSYGNYANLGVIDGLSRIVPYEIGSGDEKRARELLRSGLWGLNFITSIFLLIVIIYSFLSPFETVTENKTAVILSAIAVLLNQNFMFALTYYRIRHKFKQAYIYQLVQAVLDLTLSLLLMFKFKIVGIFWGMTLAFLIAFIFSMKNIWKEIKPKVNFHLLKEILNVGFQILLVGFTYGFLMSVDKFSVANLFEKSKMGYYSVAVGFGMIPYFVSVTLGQFVGQRMIEEFGKTKSKESIKIFLDESMLALAFITPLISILTIAVAEPFIHFLLPKYTESLRYIDKLSIAYYFLSLGAILGTFLITINQQVKLLIVNIAFIPFILFLNYLAYNTGLGLLGISYITFLNFFARTFILFILGYGNYKGLIFSTKGFLSLIISFAKFSFLSFPIFFSFALKFFIFDVYLRFYLRILISLVWFLIAFYYLLRKTEIISSMIEMAKGKVGMYLNKVLDIF